MLVDTPLGTQLERVRDDAMRILVVGAGIAGTTVAGLLRKSGLHPVVIEKSKDGGNPGYMLALMPMVDAALADLDARDAYRAVSVPLTRYRLHAHTGRTIRTDSMGDLLARYGDYRGIARGELTDVLTGDGCALTFGTTLTRIRHGEDTTTVEFATQGGADTAEFDLVIVADGIHSKTRELVLGQTPIATVDTGWGGWVVWAPADDATDLGEELWGADFFLGIYPVQGRLGIFLGGENAKTAAGREAFVAQVRRALTTTSARFESVLNAVLDEPDPYYWPLADARSPRWVTGRCVLLGDAAAGFLPTAGIGAGMAMESAWVLASLLRRADGATLTPLLRAYEQTQRPRVEAAQDTSRSLAKLMFRNSRVLAALRDVAMRFVSVSLALKPIRRLLEAPPDPTAIAAEVTGRQRASDKT